VGDAAAAVVGSVHGLVPALTSFVGRESEVGKVAGMLGEYRLVTVTGPGGVGKSRLAGEVARRAAGRFADGVWLVELAAVQEPALVPAAVAVALEVHQPPGRSLGEALTGVLARRQLLLVLDNCEHLLDAVAELGGMLLAAADDVRVLATSREPLGLAGEARYRLPPLALPGPGDPAGSEAVTLFTDRARQADAVFALTGESPALVAQIVARLDGMPLAIELAAARTEALGLPQLLVRLDHRFTLLTTGDRTASPRQRSLAATVDWSYQLLSEDEQQVFRRLAVFPGPFTLEAAQAVTGAAAEPAVLHLVDCSLLTPPRAGPDSRARYLMLETLRAYGLQRLADAGERPDADAALARYALQVAEQAAAGLQASGGEVAAARWLDAEDATTQQALTWALEHDPGTALHLAIALAPWWLLRGRSEAGYTVLRAAVGQAVGDEDTWPAGQLWLGLLADSTADLVASLSHFTAVRDAPAGGGPSPELVVALGGRSAALRNLGRVPEAADNARRALALARELGYQAGEALALYELSYVANYTGDFAASLEWAQQACRIDPAGIPDWVARWCGMVMTVALIEAGQAASAQRSCADWLAQAREAGDLQDQAYFLGYMAELDRRAGRVADAGAHLRESLRLAVRTGGRLRLIDCLDTCGHICAATGRWAEAITMWAAHDAQTEDTGLPNLPHDVHRRQEPMRKAAEALGPAQTQAAEERGAAMTLDTAAEFAIMLTDQDPQAGPALSAKGQLSPREQELVTLVARGHTDAQIAGQLYISVRTVRSHLDRIRDKTGCRRRADLTRLALQAGLV
jgi:predicted ATPase/DNA-binding CsgD family transcriptional regulator